MNKLLSSLFAVLIAATAHAETQLIASGFSYHTDQSDKPNQDNHGAGISFDLHGHEIQLGQYKNSWYHRSRYVVNNRLAFNWHNVKAGWFCGVADGYPVGTGIVPAIGGMVRINWHSVALTLRALPIMETKNSAVFTAELGIKF